jgi:hypothetical protein
VLAELNARRRLRRGFISRARAWRALAAPAPASIVSRTDYLGDFQLHSEWSDGSLTIEGMLDAVWRSVSPESA